MIRIRESVCVWMMAAALGAAPGLAEPGFDDLGVGAGPAAAEPAPAPAREVLVAGRDYPLLELDSKLQLVGQKAELWLTERGERRRLGTLAGWTGFDGYFPFVPEGAQAPAASLDWVDLTFDPAGQLRFRTGDKAAPTLGHVRQRIFMAVGTGLDVTREGAPAGEPIGYVDERVLEDAGYNLLFEGALAKKTYVFETLTYRTIQVEKRKGLPWKRRTVIEDKRVTDRKEAFRFVGARFQWGPGGVFFGPDKRPLLALKGDWWVSKHVFDLVVTRKEADGAAGIVADGLLTLLGESEEERRAREKKERELVRNPSGYLGGLLVGMAYFPAFRAALGADFPLAAEPPAAPTP